jgi:hypothetical protein
MDVDADRAKKVSIEEFVPVTAVPVAQFGIQHFRELIGDLFVFCIHELGDENPRKETREVVELDGELSEGSVRKVSGSKTGEVGIVNGAVAKHEPPHVLMERHGNPSNEEEWIGE